MSSAFNVPVFAYIDGVNGDDANVGIYSSAQGSPAPLQTWAEYTRRTGKRPFINVRVDIYVLNDLLDTDTMLLSGVIGPEGSINVHGVPTTTYSDTLTAVTPYDIASNQGDELAAGSLDWTPYVGLDSGGHGQLVVINTGNVDGPSYCWAAAPLTSPARARVSLLGVRTAGEWPQFEEIGPASIGNNFQIQQLPLVTNMITDFVTFTEDPEFYQVIVELLTLPQYITVESVYFLTSECACPNFVNEASGTGLINPFLTGIVGTTKDCYNILGLSLDCTFMNLGQWTASGLIMQNSQVFNDIFSTGSSSFQSHHDAYGVGVFDSENPFSIGYGASLVLEAPIWGQNNTGVSFSIYLGGQVLIDNDMAIKLYIANSGADITIDSYSSLPAVDPATFVPTASRALTFANFVTAVGSGGFGGAVFNPRFPTSGMISAS